MKLKFISLSLALIVASCAAMKSLNLYSINDDKEMGRQMYAQIANAKSDFPLLDSARNVAAYAHINRIMNTVLNSGVVAHRNDFEWTVKLIDSDVLNAFAVPGGKLYFYTGLIKYLDNEAQLAGVMAHEIAHVAARHSTQQMTKQLGSQYITSLLLGENPNQYLAIAGQLANGLGGLAFSRTDEYEADALAVQYLSRTEYNPLGVAGFFEKIINETGSVEQSKLQTFMSTHPSSADRVRKIREAWVANGSKTGNDFTERYQQFKNSLPK